MSGRRELSRGGPGAARVARALLALYPPSWRDRYGDEYVSLLADTGVGPRVAFSSARGALDAWIRPRPGVLSGGRRMRASVSVVWCAWIATAAGGLMYGQATEDRPFHAFNAAHPALGALYDIYVAAVHLSGLAAVAGAAVVSWSLLCRAPAGARRRVVIGLGAPIATPILFLACVAAISAIAHHSAPGGGVRPTWYMVVLGLGLLAGMGCAAPPAVLLRRHEPGPVALRVGVVAAAVATATAVIAALAVAGYEIGLRAGHGAFVAAEAQPIAAILGYVLLMAVGCGVAAVSAGRGVRALRAP